MQYDFKCFIYRHLDKFTSQWVHNGNAHTIYMRISLIMTIDIWWSSHAEFSVLRKSLFNESTTWVLTCKNQWENMMQGMKPFILHSENAACFSSFVHVSLTLF